MANLEHISTTIQNVGTNFVQTTVSLQPLKFIIHRARAEITVGTGTQVALSVREKSSPTDVIDIALEYTLTADPLDSGESVFFESQTPASNNEDIGTVYLAVKCNSGTNTVRVTLTIEPVV